MSGTTFGGWSESDGYDDRKVIPCECSRIYPAHSRKVNASSVNGVANGCTECKKDRHQREIAKAITRCRLTLARHIAAARGNRTIHRDVAIRYLQRFGGQTFAVQTSFDESEIYLQNANGTVLGKVSYTDKYPVDVETPEIPF